MRRYCGKKIKLLKEILFKLTLQPQLLETEIGLYWFSVHILLNPLNETHMY